MLLNDIILKYTPRFTFNNKRKKSIWISSQAFSKVQLKNRAYHQYLCTKDHMTTIFTSTTEIRQKKEQVVKLCPIMTILYLLFWNFLFLMQELKFIDEEKDLVAITDSKLRFLSHIVSQVKKANRLMNLIRRSYNFLNIVSFKYLFISLVRPHLEYCVTVWYTLLKKDEDLIENAIRHTSKMILWLSNLTYKERLAKN